MHVKDSSTVTVLAPSPERRRSVTPEDTRGKRKSRSVSVASYSGDDSEDSSEEERRRRRRKRKSKKSSSKKKKSSKRKRRRSVSESDSDDSDRSEEKAAEVDQSQLDAAQDLWVEKKGYTCIRIRSMEMRHLI